jgi:hypothetical protein
VIQDSQPWTEELSHAITSCEQSWIENPQASVEWLTLQAEKAVFITAFIIRKLMDSKRIEEHVCNSSIDVGVTQVQSATMEFPSYLTWQELDRYYDFDASANRRLSLRQLTNQLIHSYAFLVVGAYDNGVNDPYGFYFNSDNTRKNELLYLDWQGYKNIIRSVKRGTIDAA